MHQPPPDAIAPLSLRVTLGQLLRHAAPPGVYGVWIEADIPRLRPSFAPHPSPLPLAILVRCRTGSATLVVGADLAGIAARVARVIVRSGSAVACLESAAVRACRQLEITAAGGACVRYPLDSSSPEAVLADSLAAGRAVAASRIVYSVDSPRSPPLG